MKNEVKQAGYIALIGKPNVGKSTLMNHVLGKKISITSSKPQTTRQRMLGVKTVDDAQMIFVDTPGIHIGQKRALNRYMNKVARASLRDVDMVLFMVDVLSWDQQDKLVLDLLKKLSVPVILVINKIDKIKDKVQLLPKIAELSQKMEFSEVVPISAKNIKQVSGLESVILTYLPSSVHFFPPEQFTDRSDKYIVAEFIREKLMRGLGQELPYELTVTIDALEQSSKIVKISAIIWLAKETHKSMVIGKGGSKLKQVGTLARQDIELYYGKKALVKLWVKIKSGWVDNVKSLGDLGFNEEG